MDECRISNFSSLHGCKSLSVSLFCSRLTSGAWIEQALGCVTSLCEESPSWLLSKGRYRESRRALANLQVVRYAASTESCALVTPPPMVGPVSQKSDNVNMVVAEVEVDFHVRPGFVVLLFTKDETDAEQASRQCHHCYAYSGSIDCKHPP